MDYSDFIPSPSRPESDFLSPSSAIAEEKIALVTGAIKGLGFATSRQFARVCTMLENNFGRLSILVNNTGMAQFVVFLHGRNHTMVDEKLSRVYSLTGLNSLQDIWINSFADYLVALFVGVNCVGLVQ